MVFIVRIIFLACLCSATTASALRLFPAQRYQKGLSRLVLSQLPTDGLGNYVAGRHIVKVNGQKMAVVVPHDEQPAVVSSEDGQSSVYVPEDEGLFNKSQTRSWGPFGYIQGMQKVRPEDYLVNMNKSVSEKDDPLVGREREIEKIVEAFSHKGKKSVVLVGEPGVGKTAIVKGLAQMIVAGDLPGLTDREVLALDVGTMWGAEENKFVGQLHKRVNAALKFAEAQPEQRILFIDEIHQLLGGGSVTMEQGSPPISDIFKPALAGDKLCCIGATTIEEYDKYIDRDRAIKDRLLRIDIAEPSTDEVLVILQGIKDGYEKHHDVVIPDEVLQAIVAFSNRYLTSEKQPRKAVNLLDAASASLVRTEAKTLTREHIAAVIAERTGLEVETILKTNNDRIMRLLPALQAKIYGQDYALRRITELIAAALQGFGIDEGKRPLVSVLLGGDTGTGKTATGKVLAQELFDSEDNLIIADMSAYKNPGDVALLSDFLTREVKNKPYSVILLDEIEKANPEVLHLLLQLLDEGRLTDQRQRKVDFTNTIIMITTNSKNIKKSFLPEVLNRLDSVITYNKLDHDVTLKLVDKQLAEFNDSLQDREITITLGENAIKILAKEGYSEAFGAREMQRTFRDLIKSALMQAFSQGLITHNNSYHVDLSREPGKQFKAVITNNDEVVLETSVETISLEQALDKKEHSRPNSFL